MKRRIGLITAKSLEGHINNVKINKALTVQTEIHQFTNQSHTATERYANLTMKLSNAVKRLRFDCPVVDMALSK